MSVARPLPVPPEPAPPNAEFQRLTALQDRVRRGALALSISLSSNTLTKIEQYAQLLGLWGAKINLTAIPLDDAERVATHHFLDCLACVAQLPPTGDLPSPTLIDVGSGAGFPGVLCALLRPELQVTLVERVGKKAAFLQALRRELGLSYTVESCDAERLVPGAGTAGYGLAVSRAALPPPQWLALAVRLVAPAGYVLSMTSMAEPTPTLPGAILMAEHTYDVGAGSKRLLTWQRQTAR